MACIRRQKSGRWRAQVRRKGLTVSDTFSLRQDALDWAADREREIDRGEAPKTLAKNPIGVVAECEWMHDVGPSIRRL